MKTDLNGCDDDGHWEFILTSRDERSIGEASVMCKDLIETVCYEFFERYLAGS